MLLRVSGELVGHNIDLDVVTSGETASVDIPAAAPLCAFVDAVTGRDPALPAVREALAVEVGIEGMVDAAAAYGNFERQVRIADGTGIRLDTPVAIMTVDLRERLGLEAFPAACNTPKVGRIAATAGRLLQPLIPRIMKLFQPRS